MIVACTRLLRGAGYVAFNGELPAQAQHAALASEYAHVTAPLRRLVDRYAGEICVALCAGTDVPDWVVSAMGDLPDTMIESGRRARQYENAVVDLCEAELLKDRVGETFTAVVVEVDEEDPAQGRRDDPGPRHRGARQRLLRPAAGRGGPGEAGAGRPDLALGLVRAGLIGERPSLRVLSTGVRRRWVNNCRSAILVPQGVTHEQPARRSFR